MDTFPPPDILSIIHLNEIQSRWGCTQHIPPKRRIEVMISHFVTPQKNIIFSIHALKPQ